MRQHSVSHPRSSNRTCRFPASGSPTGFTVRHTEEITGRKSTTLRVDSSSTDDSRLRGALPLPDSCSAAKQHFFKIKARTEVLVMLQAPSWQVEVRAMSASLALQEVVMSFRTITGEKPWPDRTRTQHTLRRWLCAVRDQISEWRRRSHQREELARMSRYELRDAGINPNDAAHEIGKPFWRA
jgi:uncharacterized protein YjiS (DUF1127 family)